MSRYRGCSFVLLLLLSLGWGLSGWAHPSVSVSMGRDRFVLSFPESEEAQAVFDAFDENEQQAFQRKREMFLSGAARTLHSRSQFLYFFQPFPRLASLAFGHTPSPWLSRWFYQAQAHSYLEGLDTFLCENGRFVLEADRFGAGVAISAAYGAALHRAAHGNAKQLFISMAFNKNDFRVGMEHETLVLGTPAFLSAGIGIKFFIYISRPRGKVVERGRGFYPVIGPELMVTDHMLAASKTVGLYVPTPYTALLTTEVSRVSVGPADAWQLMTGFLGTCSQWLLARGTRPNPPEP